MLTFDALMLAYREGPSRDKRSHKRDLFSARQLYPYFTVKDLAELTGADVRNYIAKRQNDGVSAATINKEMGLVRAAMLIRTAEQVPKAAHLVDFVRLGLYTRLRPGEMLGLEWSRVDLSRNLVYLGSEDQKNGREGSVPLNKQALETVISRARFRATYWPGLPWVFSNREGERIARVHKNFASAVRAAGLGDAHPHDLRRTFGNWLVQAGVPIQTVSALLRHSDIRVTDRVYAHLSLATSRDAVGVLNGVEVSRSGFALAEKPGNWKDVSL